MILCSASPSFSSCGAGGRQEQSGPARHWRSCHRADHSCRIRFQKDDPNYRGNPVQLEMWNVGPLDVMLVEGMAICQIIFELVDGTPEKGYEGRFSIQGPNVGAVNCLLIARRRDCWGTLDDSGGGGIVRKIVPASFDKQEAAGHNEWQSEAIREVLAARAKLKRDAGACLRVSEEWAGSRVQACVRPRLCRV